MSNNKILLDKLSEIIELLVFEVSEKVQDELSYRKGSKRNELIKSSETESSSEQESFELFDVEQVAELLKVKKRTIYEWVRTNKIPYKKVGDLLRFKKAEIFKWIEEA